MADVNELICQAIDTIVLERLKEVQFDRTILCSIIDASEAENGKYLVATLSSNLNTIDKDNFSSEEREEYLTAMAHVSNTFDAYSKDTYTPGQYVYVLIPNGDFSQQKTIVGKYVTDDNEPYKDFSPFDQFIDMTGNLLPATDTFSLVANSDKQIANTGNAEDGSPTISVTFGNPFKAFTRLGLKAKFSTKLSQQKCVVGTYGIKAVLTVENISHSDKNEETVVEKYISVDLNSNNFIGNPYNFEGFYNQELIFDISAYQSIKAVKLYFYQNQGSFKNDEYLDLPWQDEFGNIIEPNLFVKDIYLGIGYSEGDIDKDTLFLYTFDETSYEQTFDPTTHAPYPMRRTLKARWVHKDEKTGRYETVGDLSSLYTSEKTSAILAADSALQQIGTSLQQNAKLKISTNFYNSYLKIMQDYRTGVAEGLNVGDKFYYVLQTNPDLDNLLNMSMTSSIRSSFIDELEQYIITLFKKLNIYKWFQEQADSFISPQDDIKKYYGSENAGTKDPPYYKHRYQTYEAQFNLLLDAFNPGGAGQTIIATDSPFLLPAKLNDGTDIFIVLNLPYNFASNCVVPFWKETIKSLRNSVKGVYDNNQGIISSYQYQLRWYHYRLGATISDSDVYAGADWRRIDENFLIDDTLLDPDPTSLTNQFEFTFTPNPKKRQEQFKCILLAGYNEDTDGNEIVFDFTQSKIFTFSNRGRVVDVDTVEKVEALSIHCRDNTFGNYFIYSLGGDITNTVESENIRYVEAYFNPSAEDIENGPLREAQTITWTFPLDTFSYIDATGEIKTITGYTMLEPEISFQDIIAQTDETDDHSNDDKMYILTSNNLLEKVYTRKKQRYQYETLGEVTDNYPDVFKIDISGGKTIYTYKCFRDGSIFNQFGYKIKGFYSQENTVNNSIGCSIVKNFISYNAVKQFNFGPSGSQGAEVVLAVNFNRDKDTLYNAVTQIEHIQDGNTIISFDDFRPARFSAFLYDADSKLVDISGAIITCQWADCVSEYQGFLDKWFVIEEYKDPGNNRWINDIPTWEVHYRRKKNDSEEDGYQDKKVSNPEFEEVTASSPEEAIQLANSVRDARINAIVEITISNYGRYDKLKTYLPIPQKTVYHWTDKDITFIPGYISGPTQVIYDGTGHCEYYKGPYTMTAFVQGEWENNIAGQWSLVYPADTDQIDTNYLPSLTSAILEPLGMYIEDAPRYGVAFSSDDFNLSSDAVGKTFLVRDLANGDIWVERLMTQELWDYILDFVTTPVNKLGEKNFVCSFSPTDNYNSFVWTVDRGENGQLLANLLHGIFPHIGDTYNLYHDFVKGNGKTYGWRITCSTAQDPYTGKRYYYQLNFSKNEKNIESDKDSYNENSDPNLAADFLQGFLSYFKSTQLHIKAGTNCWYQPIYVGQNRYMSATLNKWDGQSLSIDETNCEIVAHAVAAGKKERGPSGSVFTGVVIGQMTSETSGELSKHTGVYGINQGAMAYQFLDNGTGFIGKAGRGRILFDGNTGVIKSGLYDDTALMPIGSIIDFDDGRIELHGNTSSTAWNYGGASTTTNALYLKNASAPLYLQSGPSFGGSAPESGTIEDNNTNSLVSATFNNNRLTITMRKNYLYSTDAKWEEQFNDYKLIVVVGKNFLSSENDEDTLMPLLLKCVPNDSSITSYLSSITYYSSPLLQYKATDDTENKNPLINTINFSSRLEMLLEKFQVNYYLCGKNLLISSILSSAENTDNYESAEEGQYLDDTVSNSYNTKYKKRIHSTAEDIYGVAFEIPIEKSFKKFFEDVGAALSTTLTFTLSLTRRTVPQQPSSDEKIEAVGSLILDAGTLMIDPDSKKPSGYSSSGVPLSIGIMSRKINQNQPMGDVTEKVNFYVEWNGTMHATNGYFENENNSNYIRISSDPNNDPFKIGADHREKFKVEWDGTMHASNGYFEGDITASSGRIGGWTIQNSYLANTSNTIQLDSKHGVINGPVLRGAEIRGGAIFSNDLHVNFFTIYNWDNLDKNSSISLRKDGLQGSYNSESGLFPSSKTKFLEAIEPVKIGKIGLIRSSDGKEYTYPLGMIAYKGSIVLQVNHNEAPGNSENIRLSVPKAGFIVASVLSSNSVNETATTSLAVLAQRGIQWGPTWGQDKFAILDENYVLKPAEYDQPSGNWIGMFQGLKEFRMSDIETLILKLIKNITIEGTADSTLKVTGIPAEKQEGIYARFA